LRFQGSGSEVLELYLKLNCQEERRKILVGRRRKLTWDFREVFGREIVSYLKRIR
jgi:hypothetical protein